MVYLVATLRRQKGSIWIPDTNSGGVTAGHDVPPLRLRIPAATTAPSLAHPPTAASSVPPRRGR